MKLRKVLAILWMILLMLTATSYAENTENPIIADTQTGYIRMNLPYVKEVNYYGRSYVQCAYSTHDQLFLPPYGVPWVRDNGTNYVLFDPTDDTVLYFEKPIDIERVTMYKNRFANVSGDSLTVYNELKRMFPDLCNKVIAANRAFDAAHGNDFDQAEKAHSEKDWEMVYKYLKNIYDGGCHNSTIIRDIGWACWYLGNYDEALAWDTKRIEVAPIGTAYNERAWANYLLGNYTQALNDANLAVMKEKNNGNILDTRGSIYYALGQYDKAMADFNKSLEINDNSAHTYYYRALCNQAMGRQSDADSDYRKARKKDPDITDDITEFKNTRRKNAAAKQQRQKKFDVSGGFQQAYSKPLNSYIDIEDNFAWSDFLHNGVQPDIDVNWLIHNLWYVEVTTTDPFGGKSEGKKFVARFAPFIWLNLGQNETPVKTLELINIYDSESGRQCLYLGEAHDYDGKSVTFDTANFIVDMTSANIPKVDAGNVHTVNMVDMDGAGLKTNQVYPEPIIFHASTAQPESFTMESSDYAWNTKTQYRFTRIK